MTNIEARISPGIKALETLDRMDIFRQVVERADFGSGDAELGGFVVGELHVCWKVVGSVVGIGLASEFVTTRIPDDA